MPLATIQDLTGPDAFELIEKAKLLSSEYDAYLDDFVEETPHERLPGIHASEISTCHRRAVYTMLDTKKVDESDRKFWTLILEIGKAIHELHQNHFHRMARELKTFQFEAEAPIGQQPLAKKWGIHSSCDGIFTFSEKDPNTWNRKVSLRVGLEIKSISPSGFERLREPKPEHIEQAHVYMACLNLPMMWMLYHNKGNHNLTPSTPPWLIKFNPKLWAKLEARFQGWVDLIKAKELPEQRPGIHCGFCPYKWTCNPPDRGASQAFKRHKLRRSK